MNQRPPWANGVTVAEAPRVLGVSIDTIRRWADEGRIESYRTPGNQRRIILDTIPDGAPTTEATA